jgi:phage repressor protein C with HTH and peptisase S24 domain
MATDKPRFSITIHDDILAQVERYQADRKISTKSKAIQKLIVIGLEGETEDYETETWEIARRYRALDAHGRRVVDAVMEIEAERAEAAPVIPIRPSKVIPLFVAAAGPGEPPSQDGLDEYEVDAESKAQFAVRISGDSMEPELRDGDVVLCERKRPEIGELAVMMVNGFLLVKQYIEDGYGNMYLRSLNRARSDLDVDILTSGNDTVTPYGRVICRKLPLVRQ